MPVVTYVDPDSIHTPSSGGIAPASWFTTHESNFRSITGRVACKIYASTTQDFNPSANSNITLGSVDFNNGMTTSTANTIIVPTSYGGKYLINANARLLNAEAGTWTVTLEIRVNGTAVLVEQFISNSGNYTTIACSTVQSLAVADAITLAITTGGSFPSDSDTEVTGSYPSLSAFWLSA